MGKTGQTYWALPDGTLMSSKDFNDLAGSWYGATFAPDGDQGGWQSKFNAFQQNLKEPSLPKGYRYDKATKRIIGPNGITYDVTTGKRL